MLEGKLTYVASRGRVTAAGLALASLASVLFAVTASAAPRVAAADFTSSLVRTVDLAAISPLSPDPTGLAYLPGRNTLLMTDSDVEEDLGGTTHFPGRQCLGADTRGKRGAQHQHLVRRTDGVSHVRRAVRSCLPPSSGHCFVSDDSQKQVYDMNPGGDGSCGTRTTARRSSRRTGSGTPIPRESPTTRGMIGCSSPTARTGRSSSTRRPVPSSVTSTSRRSEWRTLRPSSSTRSAARSSSSRTARAARSSSRRPRRARCSERSTCRRRVRTSRRASPMPPRATDPGPSASTSSIEASQARTTRVSSTARCTS